MARFRDSGNFSDRSDDRATMACDRWMEAISARADGEDPGVELRLLDAHLATCVMCRGFADALAGVPARAVLVEAPEMPDLSRRVAKLNAIADRAARWGIARALLAVVAIEIVVLAAPALLLGHEHAESAHTARHLGAFAVAYAVGLLVVAVRPARARTILPVAAVLAGALVVTAVIDVVEGRVPLVGESAHLPELLSVVLVWLLARPAPARRPSGNTIPGIRAVIDPSEQSAADLIDLTDRRAEPGANGSGGPRR